MFDCGVERLISWVLVIIGTLKEQTPGGLGAVLANSTDLCTILRWPTMSLALCCVHLVASVFTELLHFGMCFPSIPQKLTTRLTFLPKTWVSHS